MFTDPRQTAITTPEIEDLLSSGTGPHENFSFPRTSRESHALGKRRVQARNENPRFSMDWNLKLIGAISPAFMLRVFGGIVPDFRTSLIDERILDNRELRVCYRVVLRIAEAKGETLSSSSSVHSVSETKGSSDASQ